MDPAPFINLFSGKVKVTFTHAITGKVLGMEKIKAHELPEFFNRPTSIKFNGEQWRVMKAVPDNAKDFIVGNKLLLHIQEKDNLNENINGFMLPTISGNKPELSETSLFTDFASAVSKEQWQQFQFLPVTQLQIVEEEMSNINDVLYPASQMNTLTGFKNMYTRNNNLQESLHISLPAFCKKLQSMKMGSMFFDADGLIKNGIAIRSSNYTYYAIVKEDYIKELSVNEFESVDEEFFDILSAFDILLADWCNGKVIMS